MPEVKLMMIRSALSYSLKRMIRKSVQDIITNEVVYLLAVLDAMVATRPSSVVTTKNLYYSDIQKCILSLVGYGHTVDAIIMHPERVSWFATMVGNDFLEATTREIKTRGIWGYYSTSTIYTHTQKFH